MTITLRSNLSRPLYTTEVDGNFTDLDGRATNLDTRLDTLETVGGYILPIVDNDNIDTAFATAIVSIRAYALLNRGRTIPIIIPRGDYNMSSTTATITLEPWMRVKTSGNVRIVAVGQTVPVFWVRNDVSPQFSQGSDSEQNSAMVLDCSNGTLLIEGNKSTGGSGIRVGNGDGTWGTAYAGSTSYWTALTGYESIFVTGMEAGLELTNNSAFCFRFRNCRFTNNVHNIRTSAAVVNYNAMEQSSFIECFLNEADTANLSLNGGTASTTAESGHQLSFYNCSLTFSEADNILINTASRYRIEFTGGRFENGNYIARSTVLSPKTLLMLSNVTRAPTKRSTSKPPYLRVDFKSVTPSGLPGTDFSVKLSNVSFDMTGAAVWSDPVMSSADNMFLADPSVRVQASNISANEVPGTVATTSSLRNQPIPHPTAFLNRNSGFEEAALATGWTTAGTGTWSRDTVRFYTGGAASAKLVCAAQIGSITSEGVPCRAGESYHGDCMYFVDAGVTGTQLFLIPELEFFYSDGTTSAGVYTKTPDSGNSNYYNRRNDAQWNRHQTGTGWIIAPAGAAFVKVRFHVSAAVTAGTNVNTTINIDNAGIFKL